jgi:hypothetical protein
VRPHSHIEYESSHSALSRTAAPRLQLPRQIAPTRPRFRIKFTNPGVVTSFLCRAPYLLRSSYAR